jgi:hypothetical protein
VIISGKRSLRLNPSSNEVSVQVAVPQKAAAAYRFTIHFFDPALKAGSGTRVHLLFQAAEASVPIVFFLGGVAYHRDNGTGHQLQASTGWHVLQVDWCRGEARAFIDAGCSSSMPS